MIYPNDHNDAQFRIVVYGASIKKEEKKREKPTYRYCRKDCRKATNRIFNNIFVAPR